MYVFFTRKAAQLRKKEKMEKMNKKKKKVYESIR